MTTRALVVCACFPLALAVASCVGELAGATDYAVDAGAYGESDEGGGIDDWTWDDEEDGDTPGQTPVGSAKRVTVRPGSTKNAELVETLPVGRSRAGAKRRVVMRLGPSDIPALSRGDRLIVPAEVQVTTRCDVGQSAAGCGYNPHVAAQIILTGERTDEDAAGAESKPLSEIQTLSCTRNEHHCMFVFRPGKTDHALVDGFDLPCVAHNNCYINLVMWAWHPEARSGGVDKVLVGGNEGNYLANGIVEGDKGRLMVIRERSIVGTDRRRRETSGGGGITVPTNAHPTVIYSHRLKRGDLKAGEQFLVEAKLVVDTSSRARFSTLMFTSKDPRAAEGSGLQKINPVQVGEHNGINCSRGSSPCIVRKVAVFRVTEHTSGPVYVNVVAKSAVPGGGSAKVTVERNQGWVRSIRYRAALSD